jgi:hypothetical protein
MRAGQACRPGALRDLEATDHVRAECERPSSRFSAV